MIIAIRIVGQIGIERKKKETLDSLLMRRKYTAILLNEKDIKRLNTIKELITFGELDDATLKELLIKRGKKGKKLIDDADKVIVDLKKGKSLKELGLTTHFGLHPPRGGMKKSTKLPYPKGILGKNKDIIALVKRML